MPEHKIRVRRYRGIRAEISLRAQDYPLELRAQDYPLEHLVSWWMTCRAIGCPVNRGTWAYSWTAAVTWAICHRVNPDWKPGDVLPVRDPMEMCSNCGRSWRWHWKGKDIRCPEQSTVWKPSGETAGD